MTHAAALQRFFAQAAPGSDTTWAMFHATDRAPRLERMESGDGARYREATRAGLYRCPLPECDGRLVVHAGVARAHHWQHATTPSVEHSPETLWHLTAKAALAEWGTRQVPEAEVVIDSRRTSGGRQPDVWVRWTGGEVAFEAQHSALSGEQLAARSASYVDSNITPVWLFSHLLAPVLAGDSAATGGELLRLKQAHQAAAVVGPLRWFNPDLRMIATAYVEEIQRPDNRRGERWLGAKVEPIRYVRRPRPDDRYVSVHLDPLDTCTLDQAGLHTPSDRLIAAQAERAEALDALAVQAHKEHQARQASVAEQRRQESAARDAVRQAHARSIERQAWLRAARLKRQDMLAEEQRTDGQLLSGAPPAVPETAPGQVPDPHSADGLVELLDRDCYVCRIEGRPGVPLGLAPIEEKPDWYLAPAAATHLVACSGCGQICSTR